MVSAGSSQTGGLPTVCPSVVQDLHFTGDNLVRIMTKDTTPIHQLPNVLSDPPLTVLAAR